MALWVDPVSSSDFVFLKNLFILDCFAEQLLLKSTLSRMNVEQREVEQDFIRPSENIAEELNELMLTLFTAISN